MDNYTQQFHDVYPNAKKEGGSEWLILCHNHDDTRPSLSVDPKKGVFRCNTCKIGGHITKLPQMSAGTDNPPASLEVSAAVRETARVIDANLTQTYDYENDAGKVIHRTLRYEEEGKKKTFRQQGKPNGSWNTNLDGVEKVLYNLTEVLKAEEVVLVEGEKDADTLIGLGIVATTNPMGANVWESQYTKFLAGKKIIIIPDNDKEGRKHLHKVASALSESSTVHILNLPGLAPKGDVSDWLGGGNEFPELLDLIASAPEQEQKVEKGLTSTEKLYYALDKAKKFNNSLSTEELCVEMDITKGALTKIISKEKTNKYSNIRIEKAGKRFFYSLSGSKGFRRVSKAPAKVETFAPLPGGMDKLIGTRWGGRLKQETFFVFAAYGDRGKSQCLLNIAMHYVRKGLKVAYIRHEADDVEFSVDVGQRVLGRTIDPLSEDTEVIWDAVDALPGTLLPYVAPEESDLMEFCEEIQGIRPDVCIYDYMSQELTDITVDSGKSIIAKMVNILSDHIVKKGIPLFTAVQVEDADNYEVNPRWLRRATNVLWITESRVDQDGMTYTMFVKKNKQGGVQEKDYIRVCCDPLTWEFDQSWKATEQVEQEKLEAQVRLQLEKNRIKKEIMDQM